MSQYIKSSAELSALRNSARKGGDCTISGFTEAELVAAEWARDLVETKQNLARPTNLDTRLPGREGEKKVTRQSDSQIAQHQHDRVSPKSKKSRDKKEKVRDKEKKRKDKKATKNLTKDARRLAKKMRREEKERCKKEKQHTQSEIIHNIETEAASHNAIDELIEHARLRVDVACTISTQMTDDSSAKEGSQKQDECLKGSNSSAQQETSTLPASDGTLPRDPLNPLGKAHDLEAYKKLCLGLSRKDSKRHSNSDDEPTWDHWPYLHRSPSPCRLRTPGAMWPTRLGAWKSRAGGVYLPPTDGKEVPGEGFHAHRRQRSKSPDESPARYLYPEEFEKYVIPARRRSPSYAPQPRCRSSSSERERCLSVSRSRSRFAMKKKRKRRRKPSKSSAASQNDRDSPVYELEAGPKQKDNTCEGDTRCENKAETQTGVA